MENVRAFVGIPLPQACQELVGDLGHLLAPLARGRISPVRAGNAHLTLRFLGDVPRSGPAGALAVAEALAGVAFTRFTLRLAGGGFFPGPRRPRVVWAGLAEGAGTCQTLAGAVEAALSPLGFAPEGKPFTAHLTLARLREPGRGGDWPAMLGILAETAWPAVTVASFTLWRSAQAGSGTRHEVLADFPATAEA